MSKSLVKIEYMGPSEPALIHKGRRATPQWLGPSTVAALNGKSSGMFMAENIDGVWYVDDIAPECVTRSVSRNLIED